MSWPIRLHAERPENPTVGDMWPAPWLDTGADSGWVSDDYRRDWLGKRAPLVVRLPSKGMPNGFEFCIDSRCSGKSTGWAVTGDPPNVTLAPSINCVGVYHGFIRDGVITDDCEGRTFP